MSGSPKEADMVNYKSEIYFTQASENIVNVE